MAKKKKKKKKKGARRSTYAKGKKTEAPATKKGVVSKTKVAPKGGKMATKAKEEEPARGRWNRIRKGNPEMQIFKVILLVVAVGALLQYPLWNGAVTDDYHKLKENYPKELKKWEEKYTTESEREKHKEEKPQAPHKPTFNEFLIYQAFMVVLQGALFAFIGLNVAARTDLLQPLLEKVESGQWGVVEVQKLVPRGIVWGFVVLVPLVLSSVAGRFLGFSKATKIEYSAWKESLYFANLSIQHQLLFLVMIMSALVWLFMRYRDKMKLEPHWAGIAVAFIFCFVYFFNISRVGGEKVLAGVLGSLLVATSVVLVLGYVYWKKGIEYSLLAGVIGFGLYPFLAALIVK